MTLAEELVAKYTAQPIAVHARVRMAEPDAIAMVNEALERAAMECEAVGEQYGIRAGTPKECAARIRALKGA